MPLLDVSFLCEDPMLSDTFDVRRRLSSVGPDGRSRVAPDQVFSGLVGVVTQQDSGKISRSEDGAVLPRTISVVSRFRFVALEEGSQPDEVLWDGVLYTVQQSLPYSTFGAGFYEALAEYRGPVPPGQ